MRLSCIMPSHLGPYAGAAPNRPKNFMRAVDSFLKNTHQDKELIVISDGCPTTTDILNRHYKKELISRLIKLIELPRHEVFTGAVRQAGIDIATGEVLCNLDGDDTLTPNHLHNIATRFNPENYDWCHWNHITKPDELRDVEYFTDVRPELGSLNNGNHALKRGLDVTWNGCDGIHDNQAFIDQLIKKYPRKQKLYGCGYVIRHIQIRPAP